MPRYDVHATVSMIGWVTVMADTPGEALEIARGMSADSFETDSGTAELDFNVEPAVELL